MFYLRKSQCCLPALEVVQAPAEPAQQGIQGSISTITPIASDTMDVDHLVDEQGFDLLQTPAPKLQGVVNRAATATDNSWQSSKTGHSDHVQDRTDLKDSFTHGEADTSSPEKIRHRHKKKLKERKSAIEREKCPLTDPTECDSNADAVLDTFRATEKQQLYWVNENNTSALSGVLQTDFITSDFTGVDSPDSDIPVINGESLLVRNLSVSASLSPKQYELDTGRIQPSVNSDCIGQPTSPHPGDASIRILEKKQKNNKTSVAQNVQEQGSVDVEGENIPRAVVCILPPTSPSCSKISRMDYPSPPRIRRLLITGDPDTMQFLEKSASTCPQSHDVEDLLDDGGVDLLQTSASKVRHAASANSGLSRRSKPDGDRSEDLKKIGLYVSPYRGKPAGKQCPEAFSQSAQQTVQRDRGLVRELITSPEKRPLSKSDRKTEGTENDLQDRLLERYKDIASSTPVKVTRDPRKELNSPNLSLVASGTSLAAGYSMSQSSIILRSSKSQPSHSAQVCGDSISPTEEVVSSAGDFENPGSVLERLDDCSCPAMPQEDSEAETAGSVKMKRKRKIARVNRDEKGKFKSREPEQNFTEREISEIAIVNRDERGRFRSKDAEQNFTQRGRNKKRKKKKKTARRSDYGQGTRSDNGSKKKSTAERTKPSENDQQITEDNDDVHLFDEQSNTLKSIELCTPDATAPSTSGNIVTVGEQQEQCSTLPLPGNGDNHGNSSPTYNECCKETNFGHDPLNSEEPDLERMDNSKGHSATQRESERSGLIKKRKKEKNVGKKDENQRCWAEVVEESVTEEDFGPNEMELLPGLHQVTVLMNKKKKMKAKREKGSENGEEMCNQQDRRLPVSESDPDMSSCSQIVTSPCPEQSSQSKGTEHNIMEASEEEEQIHSTCSTENHGEPLSEAVAVVIEPDRQDRSLQTMTEKRWQSETHGNPHVGVSTDKDIQRSDVSPAVITSLVSSLTSTDVTESRKDMEKYKYRARNDGETRESSLASTVVIAESENTGNETAESSVTSTTMESKIAGKQPIQYKSRKEKESRKKKTGKEKNLVAGSSKTWPESSVAIRGHDHPVLHNRYLLGQPNLHRCEQGMSHQELKLFHYLHATPVASATAAQATMSEITKKGLLGWMSGGKWKPQEDNRLRINWEDYLQAYKERIHCSPGLLLGLGHGTIDCSSRKKLRQLMKETNFYRKLGMGIKRTIRSVYQRATRLYEYQLANKEKPRQVSRARRWSWTEEELDRLMNRVNEEMQKGNYGTSYRQLPWSDIAKAVGTRNDRQCRSKW